MADLARAVEALLPGWRIRGATLAGEGTLEAALAGLGPGAVLVYPHFMADGWFVRQQLPRRLRAAGRPEAAVLPPFGLAPETAALALRLAREGTTAHGLAPEASTLLLAAHGSPSDPRPAAVTRRVAAAIARAGHFRSVRVGFVDEEPRLAVAARLPGPALCLPFFAARNSHVEVDLPEALAEAGFPGPILPPVGTDAAVPRIIADGLARAALARVA
ncbi:MAG TPA: CbiX/SirB N-terminal domain-containing protein [Amaricoccus sp.]|nr:CbiX/SirB N-terminal domain-containing protein [Amaricoccus sp.]